MTPLKHASLLKINDPRQKYGTPEGPVFVEVCLPHLHRASVAVYFRAGSRFETPEENGISHFLEHMIFRGTEKRPTTYAVNHAVESLGAVLFAATSPSSTEFEMTLPPESLVSGVYLLSEILTQPIFGDMDIERRIILEEALEDYDESGNCIDWDFLSRSRLWPGHALGQSVTGPLENIERFTNADVRAHFEKYYTMQNAVVCVSGAFDPKVIRPVLQSSFSKLPGGGLLAVASPPALGKGPTINHVKKPGSQTQLRIAFHAPGEDDPDSVPASVLMGILDDGMSTLLHRRIFDERGLAYNVSAGMDSYSDVAALGIDAATSHANVPETAALILQLAMELKSALPDLDELEKAKRRARWALEHFLDEPQSMNAWYGEQELYRKAPSLAERAEDYSRITAEDVRRVAERIFVRENLHLTTVGMLTKKAAVAIEQAVNKFR